MVDRDTFERLVAEAMDGVPEPFATAFAQVAVIVEERAPADDPDLYGLYLGVPLDEPWAADGQLPPIATQLPRPEPPCRSNRIRWPPPAMR